MDLETRVRHWTALTVGRLRPSDAGQRRHTRILQGAATGLASKGVGTLVAIASVPLTLRYLGADLGVRGDGEAVFPELLRRLGAGEDPSGLPGVHVAGRAGASEPSFPGELGGLPQWDGSLDFAEDPAAPDLWVPVQARRGCPNDCSYCSTARIQGRRIRSRPAGEVADHVAGLAARGYRRAYFVDNTFNLPEAYALELCRALGRRGPGLEWRCIV